MLCACCVHAVRSQHASPSLHRTVGTDACVCRRGWVTPRRVTWHSRRPAPFPLLLQALAQAQAISRLPPCARRPAKTIVQHQLARAVLGSQQYDTHLPLFLPLLLLGAGSLGWHHSTASLFTTAGSQCQCLPA